MRHQMDVANSGERERERDRQTDRQTETETDTGMSWLGQAAAKHAKRRSEERVGKECKA